MENNNPRFTLFRSLAEAKIVPHSIKAQEVKVSFFNAGNLIENYSNIEYQAIKYAIEKVDFTKEQFCTYCKLLVQSRISYVLDEDPIIKPNDHVSVPSFLMNILMQIGIAEDIRTGVVVRPERYEKKRVIIPMDDVRKISKRLESIKDYACGFGYPTDKFGAWDFMTMQLIDNQIVSHMEVDSSLLAIMASVIGPKLIQAVLTPLVLYGDTNFMEGLLWQLTSI